MIFGFSGRLNQFVDDMGRGGLIRIAHPEVDNILTPLTRLKFQGLYLGKYVRRKSFDAVKSVADRHVVVRLLQAGPLLNWFDRHASERGVF
ncbi:hypothetical protein NSPZN2_11501 [Nitrospira defluvii]|uniref:Uncharacterized protein n=1 Tax=Nitrospira defluvii TaxID=330214 RepID=A0ABM8QV54_9BACT|nr:hypothetical protein NSPZN2_11501 [Nitrospira defluvii]